MRPADVEELSAGEPAEVVIENALRKARAVEGERVLACDTEVFLDGEIFGKPRTAADARAYLERLSGRAHEVWGGLVMRCGETELTATAVTRVRFRALDPDEIDDYVATGEWHGRAGGYAIQGRGAALVEGIDGDFWNVVGLPVPELVGMLKSPC